MSGPLCRIGTGAELVPIDRNGLCRRCALDSCAPFRRARRRWGRDASLFPRPLGNVSSSDGFDTAVHVGIGCAVTLDRCNRSFGREYDTGTIRSAVLGCDLRRHAQVAFAARTMTARSWDDAYLPERRGIECEQCRARSNPRSRPFGRDNSAHVAAVGKDSVRRGLRVGQRRLPPLTSPTSRSSPTP